MIERSVYLAGPIAGLTYQQAREWRWAAKSYFKPYGIKVYDPLNGAEHLMDAGVLDTSSHEENPMTSAKGIMAQDFLYCTKAGMVLANFTGANRISCGTVMECAWAYQARVPLVVVGDDLHDHTMLHSAADFWVDTLAVALEICRKVLM